MQHVAIKATVAEVTDLGEFTAIAATYSPDRVNDQIVLGAFEKTIAQWRASGRNIPVHWNHSGDAKDVIGEIDPATMRELAGEGLYVAGRLHLQESEVAREAWRSMKSNTVALSFGYLATKTRKRGRIQELHEIDLFEITVAPGPVNPETRFLSLKAAATERRIPTNEELVAQAKALGLEIPLTSAELRRRSDDVALEAALGFSLYPAPNPSPSTPGRLKPSCGASATWSPSKS